METLRFHWHRSLETGDWCLIKLGMLFEVLGGNFGVHIGHNRRVPGREQTSSVFFYTGYWYPIGHTLNVIKRYQVFRILNTWVYVCYAIRDISVRVMS